MKVEDLMVKDVSACCPDSALNDAARIMWERDCGFVPVVESSASPRVVGVITDRDACMAAYTRGASLKELRVADAMSRRVYSCRAGDPLSEALTHLVEAKVRRLPVIDDRGQLLGVISLADIARATGRGKKRLGPTEVGTLLAGICQRRELPIPANA